MKSLRSGSLFVFRPVGPDLWDRRDHTPAEGTVVQVVPAPRGCPKNGTMGHCYIGKARTGLFIGLVSADSLVPLKDAQKTGWTVEIDRHPFAVFESEITALEVAPRRPELVEVRVVRPKSNPERVRT